MIALNYFKMEYTCQSYLFHQLHYVEAWAVAHNFIAIPRGCHGSNTTINSNQNLLRLYLEIPTFQPTGYSNL